MSVCFIPPYTPLLYIVKLGLQGYTLFAVGLDSEKRIVSEKMRKDAKRV